jgi:hypothetical protein
MPVHNAGRYLREAIDSILCQTFTDFEFLIVDDASTDDTAVVISAVKDARIRVLNTKLCRGISAALNLGLTHARGEYLARMDADDICLPHRLAVQVSFLDQHPGLGMCGCWVKIFGDGIVSRVFRRPLEPDAVQASLLFGNPFVHPSVVVRRALMERHNLRYNDEFNGAEDYELWVRSLKWFCGQNISQVLLQYRQHASSVTSQAKPVMNEKTGLIIRKQLERLDIPVSREHFDLHLLICQDWLPPAGTGEQYVEHVESWLMMILKANERVGVFPRTELKELVSEMWLRSCLSVTRSGGRVLSCYLRSPLRQRVPGVPFDRLIMLTAALRSSFVAGRRT